MKHQIKTLLFTIKIVLGMNKKLFLIVSVLSFISSIAPIALLQITQTIFNMIQAMELPFAEVLPWIIVYVFFSIFMKLLSSTSNYFTRKFNISLLYSMKYKLMKKCTELPLESLEKTETYDMINRLENEAGSKPYEALNALVGMVSSVAPFIWVGVILFNWQMWLFFLMLGISVIHFIAYLKLTDKEFNMRFNRSNREREVWYYSFLLMRDTAFKEVKVLNLKDHFLKRYWNSVQKFMKEENDINKLNILLNLASLTIQDIIAAVVMFLAIREAYLGIILIGTALVYMNITGIIQNATSSLAGYIRSLYNSNLYMNLLKEFLELESEEISKGADLSDIEKLEVRNLTYDYPNQRNVLEALNFEILKGERVAIVGENGSGKSTLLKLLCGLYQPKEGSVLINGAPLSEIRMSSYRKNISVLFQDFLKFEGSLLDNIHIGHIEREVKKDDIKQALEFTNVNFFKEQDDYLYEDYLGNWFEDGSQLSGGQWQKIALARAYYKEAPLYLLDEPSSALDVNAELEIFKSFFHKSENRIGIFITHRIKIAKQADKIIMMEKGKVIGVGSHQHLYENCELYQDLLLKEQELDISGEDERNIKLKQVG